MRRLLAMWFVTLSVAAGVGAETAPFLERRAGFTLRAHGEEIPFETFGLFLMPGETLEVSIRERARQAGSRLTASWSRSDGRAALAEIAPGHWQGPVPSQAGVQTVRVESGGEAIHLNVFVMVPATEIRGGSLRGYRLGSYPQKPYRGLTLYQPPRGYVEVTEKNRDLEVGPHFTLGQFLCKQAGGYPKFVVMRERMILKLEYLLALVNEHGLRADTFFVMSGYRTPSYNASIGNVGYSRHQYGDAADIFIDEKPRDGVMDDLNGDGRSDRADGNYLYDLIDAASRGAIDFELLVGGLGAYGATRAHGPFVHVDARGFRARWGR